MTGLHRASHQLGDVARRNLLILVQGLDSVGNHHGAVRACSGDNLRRPRQRLFDARDVDVPGDISSAVYYIAAATLLEGSSLEIVNVGLNPGRVGFLDVVGS